MKKKIIIGSVDKIRLPEITQALVQAKIDSGAHRSAIHATRIKVVEKGGRKVLRCYLLNGIKKEFDDFDQKNVTSSNGIAETRYEVKILIKIFSKKYRTSFTLANRKNMTYPILLGRMFLRHRFMIDVSQKNLSYQSELNTITQ